MIEKILDLLAKTTKKKYKIKYIEDLSEDVNIASVGGLLFMYDKEKKNVFVSRRDTDGVTISKKQKQEMIKASKYLAKNGFDSVYDEVLRVV